MTIRIKKLYFRIFLLANVHTILEAAWYETVDDNGNIEIQHTIPRIKRLQTLPSQDDYQLANKFDEYPIIVPQKRGALLLDRIMVALQKAVDNGKDANMRGYYPDLMNGLKRRGQEKGKVYWRCYFNAVTCF